MWNERLLSPDGDSWEKLHISETSSVSLLWSYLNCKVCVYVLVCGYLCVCVFVCLCVFAVCSAKLTISDLTRSSTTKTRVKHKWDITPKSTKVANSEEVSTTWWHQLFSRGVVKRKSQATTKIVVSVFMGTDKWDLSSIVIKKYGSSIRKPHPRRSVLITSARLSGALTHHHRLADGDIPPWPHSPPQAVWPKSFIYTIRSPVSPQWPQQWLALQSSHNAPCLQSASPLQRARGRGIAPERSPEAPEPRSTTNRVSPACHGLSRERPKDREEEFRITVGQPVRSLPTSVSNPTGLPVWAAPVQFFPHQGKNLLGTDNADLGYTNSSQRARASRSYGLFNWGF